MKLSDDLRQSVLQAAIEGKLTKQLESDGSSIDLIKRADAISINGAINGVKVKNKIIKEFNKMDVELSIPDNWEFIQLGKIANIARGGSPRPIKQYLTADPNGINWIKIGDTDKNGKYISHTKEKIIPAGIAKSRFVHSGDFLLTNSMSFGRPYILKTDGCIHDGWLVISQPIKIFDEDYLYYLLSSNFIFKQFSNAVSGAVVKNLNSEKVANTIVPLPPLAEQHRIVEKVDVLMAEIDELEKKENELEKLKKEFPEDMKVSLLQAAMEGKLTEQLPEDGDARDLLAQIKAEKERLIKEKKIKKKKPLKPISEDEVPFDVPENWKWCYLGDIFNHNAGKALNARNTKGEKHKYITTSNVYWDHFELDNLREMYYTPDEVEKYSVRKGDLLVLEGGDIGRTAIWDRDETYCVQNHVHRLRPYLKVDVKYFYYCMMYYKNSGMIYGKGIAIQGLSANALHCINIPLPPLAEQHRIVKKLDELLPLCEELKEDDACG